MLSPDEYLRELQGFDNTRSESYTDRKGTEALEHVERKACPEKTNLSGKAFSELEKNVSSTTETRAL